MTRDKQLVGAAGEHLVLSRLLNLGYLAAQAPRGTRKVDVLVNHLENKPPCLIQVKTRTGVDADQGWHMSVKHEEMRDTDMFYCFVALGEIESNVYVIPAVNVADAVLIIVNEYASIDDAFPADIAAGTFGVTADPSILIVFG